MATVTDNTYYQSGKKFIPNTSDQDAGYGVASKDTLNDIIIDTERQLLIDCLNVTLYNELTIALDNLPSADQKWRDLVEGKSYTKDGDTFYWEGLRGFNKNSLVAYYVFCAYMQNDDSYYSTTGVKKVEANGSVNSGTTKKYVNAFNEFVAKYQDKYREDEVSYFVDCYGAVVGVDYYNQQNKSQNVSLEKFLKDHPDDFPDIAFRRYEMLNTWGI